MPVIYILCIRTNLQRVYDYGNVQFIANHWERTQLRRNEPLCSSVHAGYQLQLSYASLSTVRSVISSLRNNLVVRDE